MALHLRPVGPLPEATYWRRRGAAALPVLGLLVLLATCQGAPARPAAPAPGAGATASAAGVPLCPDGSLQIVPTPTRPAYPRDGEPELRLEVRNVGSVPCVRDLGPGAVELAVLVGTERVWSSTDCLSPGPALPTVLAPGESEVTTVVWPGRRSARGCPGAQPQAPAGRYRVIGQVGTLRRPGGVFQLG